jgi:hypothetical protein
MPRKPYSRAVKPATSPQWHRRSKQRSPYPWKDGLPTGPFTREMAHTALREALKGNARLPSPGGSAVAHLVCYLNLLWWKVWGWTGPWLEEQGRHEMIAWAIQVLTEVLPLQRKDYIAATTPGEWKIKGAAGTAAKAREDLATFKALVAAARKARRRGLPLAFNMMLVMSKPIYRWQDFAEDSHRVFLSALSRVDKTAKFKEAGYRFIRAIVPQITGEQPGYNAVKTELTREANRVKKRATEERAREPIWLVESLKRQSQILRFRGQIKNADDAQRAARYLARYLRRLSKA